MKSQHETALRANDKTPRTAPDDTEIPTAKRKKEHKTTKTSNTKLHPIEHESAKKSNAKTPKKNAKTPGNPGGNRRKTTAPNREVISRFANGRGHRRSRGEERPRPSGIVSSG
jgi:hypothetical protein